MSCFLYQLNSVQCMRNLRLTQDKWKDIQVGKNNGHLHDNFECFTYIINFIHTFPLYIQDNVCSCIIHSMRKILLVHSLHIEEGTTIERAILRGPVLKTIETGLLHGSPLQERIVAMTSDARLSDQTPPCWISSFQICRDPCNRFFHFRPSLFQVNKSAHGFYKRDLHFYIRHGELNIWRYFRWSEPSKVLISKGRGWDYCECVNC